MVDRLFLSTKYNYDSIKIRTALAVTGLIFVHKKPNLIL
jgi:hypothetical protein